MSDNPSVVIGAGVVGLACAAALARGGHSVVIIDREQRHGRGTSSRNSGVVHSGLYYARGSLKAQYCVEGRERLYRYAEVRGVAYRRCGKLIVATAEAELAKLEELAARGRANGVDDLEWLGGRELEREAPGVRGIAALVSPSTGIIDVHGLMDALLAEATALGACFVGRTRFLGAERRDEEWVLSLESPAGEVEECPAAWVVNAAGLFADEVAAQVRPDLEEAGLVQEWVKGNYFSIRPAARASVERLVYPCPAPQLRGLGTHLTLDLDGGQRLGPDIEPLPRRTEDYSVDPGRVSSFLAAARRYLPDLAQDDLSPAFAGIRPQRRMTGERDFYAEHEAAHGAPHWINLVGIESPGLTAALALAEHVARLAAA